MVIKQYIDKWRKTAELEFTRRYARVPTWRDAILESLFHPENQVRNGKTRMSHLHPDIDKLHLPHGVYIADWRKYRVEDHPALVEFQKKCHAAGLHDPWLRNNCHHFYPRRYFAASNMKIVTHQLGKGFLIGLAFWIPKYLYVDYFKLYKFEHTPDYIEKYGHEEVFH